MIHEPVDDITDKWQTRISTLETICNFINDNNMQYYRMSDLIGMLNQTARTTSTLDLETLEVIEEKSPVAINVFPNPLKDVTNIEFLVQEDNKYANLSVIDLHGKTIRRLLLDEILSAGTHTMTWNGLDDTGKIATPGMYLIKVNTGNKCYFERVIKH